MPRREFQECELCHRTLRAGTTRHHLIPKCCHRTRWFKDRYTRQQLAETINVCRACHKEIHRHVPTGKELGRHYNTVETLLAHPQIGKFVQWVSKQT